MRRLTLSLWLLFSLAWAGLSGCGGDGAKTIANLTISPMSATLRPGQVQQFSTNVGTQLAWTVNGAAGGNATIGTITPSGLYSAPARVPNPNAVSITASANGLSATAVVKIVSTSAVSIHRLKQSEPIELGTSGGDAKDENSTACCSGTLGALVSRNGQLYILSASHVLARAGIASPGENITQPGLVDTSCNAAAGQVVAHFAQTTDINAGVADAALATIVPGAVDSSGGILQFGAGGGDGPPASGSVAPSVGMTVAKSGRSTGLTCSSVSSTNTSVQVDFEKGCGGTPFTATFSDQVVVDGAAFSAGGDSGALIVNAQSAQPVALLYAGNDTSTIGDPIDRVLAALPDPGNGATPTIVGGSQHAIACAPAQSATLSAGGAGIAAADVAQARQAQRRWEKRLFGIPGVQGVGIGNDEQRPGRAALVVYVRRGSQAAVPKTIEGHATKIVEAERFRAFGWNEAKMASCPK